MFILGIAIPCHSLVCQGCCGLLHSSCCETSHGKPRTNNNDHGFGSGTRPRSDYVGPEAMSAMCCGLVSGRQLDAIPLFCSNHPVPCCINDKPHSCSQTRPWRPGRPASNEDSSSQPSGEIVPTAPLLWSFLWAIALLSFRPWLWVLALLPDPIHVVTLGSSLAHEFAEVGPAMSAIGIAENHRLSPWNSTMACPDVHLRCWRVHWHQPQSRTLDPHLEVVAVQRYGRRVSSQNSILSLKLLKV